MREWVQGFLVLTRDRIDEAEAELETLAESGASKRDKEKGAARLELLLKSRRAHEAKLEALTRLIDNELVDPQDAQELRYQLSEHFEENEAADCEDDDAIAASLEVYDCIEQLRAREGGAADDTHSTARQRRASAPPSCCQSSRFMLFTGSRQIVSTATPSLSRATLTNCCVFTSTPSPS